MNDIFNYIFNNMNRLDNKQDKIIKVLNRCKRNNRFLSRTTAYLCVVSLICGLTLYKHNVDINILDRKIKELEARLNEDADSGKEV